MCAHSLGAVSSREGNGKVQATATGIGPVPGLPGKVSTPWRPGMHVTTISATLFLLIQLGYGHGWIYPWGFEASPGPVALGGWGCHTAFLLLCLSFFIHQPWSSESSENWCTTRHPFSYSLAYLYIFKKLKNKCQQQ